MGGIAAASLNRRRRVALRSTGITLSSLPKHGLSVLIGRKSLLTNITGNPRKLDVVHLHCISFSPCLAPSPLMDEAAEPVLETRRADARVIAGGEALIVQLCAEVARVDVCGHLPRVFGCAQESPDEFVETYPFRSRQFDRAVQRFLDCDIGQRGSDVIRR